MSDRPKGETTETKNLVERIRDSLERLVTLEIVTAVGPPRLDDNGHPEVDFSKDQVMVSQINLIAGDITNTMDPTFVDGDYAALRPFHEEQVAKGQEIIRENLQALEELYKFARELDSSEKSES